MYLLCNGFSLISTCSTYSLLTALAYYQHGVVSRNHIMGVVQTLVFLMQPAVTISWGYVSDVSNSIHTHDLWTYFKGKYWYQDADMGYHSIPRYQYYCPTLALRPSRMCEANWNHGAGVELNSVFHQLTMSAYWPWQVSSWKYLSYASAVFSSIQLPTAILYQLVQSILCRENNINSTEISGTNWDSNWDLLWVKVRFSYYEMLLSVVKTWVGPGCTY